MAKNTNNKKSEVRSPESDVQKMRHSLSHILAAAVLEMFPEAKLGIGPAIENGFYYDFDLPRTLIPEDLPILEERMWGIIKKDSPFEKTDVPIEDAIKEAKKRNEIYKLELLNDLKKDGEKKVTFFRTGNFVDLCKGPHLSSTGKVGAFKLHKISGAYWRGDEKNKMLQRIYGLAFMTEKELTSYLELEEEAKKRDHRKLGQELDLFCFSDLIGSGLPLFTPKGMIIIDELKNHVEKICRQYGFQKVSTPALAKIYLYEISGHKQKFGDELFKVFSKQNQEHVLRPVLCPHQTQIYASRSRSYRDLPIRYMESDKMYRAEKAGEVGGLNRVYAITVEDGHSFCRPDQVKEEVRGLVNIIKEFYSSLGMMDEFWLSISIRDPRTPEKYIGDKKDWDLCEKILQDVSNEMNLNGIRCEGEAALYGPKLDFQFRSIGGKEFAIPTVQIDFATPKRFGLKFINSQGKEETPVMVHRAILGSYERFLAMLIEHFAGAFPLWLSPVQAVVIPISDIKHGKYAHGVAEELKKENIRVEVDERPESLGRRIRDNEMQKVPYMILVGDKEIESKKISIRSLKKGDLGQKDLKRFIEDLGKEIEHKK